jgi:hypothetical protein
MLTNIPEALRSGDGGSKHLRNVGKFILDYTVVRLSYKWDELSWPQIGPRDQLNA